MWILLLGGLLRLLDLYYVVEYLHHPVAFIVVVRRSLRPVGANLMRHLVLMMPMGRFLHI
jgi:hypothetical protein